MKKKNCSAIVVLLQLMIVASPSFAQNLEEDTSRARKLGLYPFPILFYTPETGMAGGIAALYLHRDPIANPTGRLSNFTGDVIYSAKKQIIIELNGDIYFDKNNYRLLVGASYKKFPNKFFGIGNNNASDAGESYTSESSFMKAVLYKKIYSRINLGPVVRFETTSILETKPAGLLAPGSIAGSKGGFVSGIGIVVNWDSRDNTFACYTGSFLQVTSLFYRRAFGSDFSYTDIQLDARNFIELSPSQILALQATAEIIGGVAPFQNLARFGGANLLRGYFDGQYRDDTAVALQAEYRIPIWWRIGAVAFAGVAQVSDKVSRWSIGEFKFGGGAGVRFVLSPEERVTLRVDLGFGDNSSGLYFTATEAF